MKTTLLIARHGNTFGSGDVVTRLGKTDLPLVESGRKQGRLLGRYLAQHGLRPKVIFTSAMQRTQQTADEAEAEMGTHLPRHALEIFNEIDYGPDENQPEEQVRVRLGEAALKAWDEQAVVPNGWHADPQQIISAWRDFAADVLKNYAGKVILVVTSNGIARFSPELTGDMDGFKQRHGLKIATGALCIFTHEGGKDWICEAWNVRADRM